MTSTITTNYQPAGSKPWDRLASDLTTATYQKLSTNSARWMLERLDSHLPFSAIAPYLIDVGCGTAPLTSVFLQDYGGALPNSTAVIPTDFSAALIDHVRAIKESHIAAGNPIWKIVDPQVADACDLSQFSDGKFSHYAAGMVLMMVPDPTKALAEANRVLRGNGAISLTAWKGNEWMDIAGLITSVRADLQLPKLIKEGWDSVEGVRGHLEEAWFRDVDVVERKVGMEFGSVEGCLNMVEGMPFMKGMVGGLNGEEKERWSDIATRDVERRMQGREKMGRLEGVMILASGRK